MQLSVHVWRWRVRTCLLAALGFAAITGNGQSPSNEFWQAQSIYQVITDRFFDGDASNNNAEGNYNAGNNQSVHGGDFKGLEQKLDYIKALGATAIWISPVVRNGHGQFHGYAGRDFYSVAPHWGGLTDLQHMIQAAHARGLLVINDVVVNHGDDLVYSPDAGFANFLAPPAGYNLRYRDGANLYAVPFNTNAANPSLTNLFHNNGGIPDYNTAQHVELGELSGLDDFRTESDYVRSNMVEVYKYWVGQAGFDGFRIDTVKHVEMGFWQNWCPSVHAYAATNGLPNFFMFGEVYDGSDSKCGSYTGTKGGGAWALDSVLDYPLYFKVNSVFATASGSTSQIEDRYAAIASNYDPAAQMRLVTFLDNHDQPRFLSSGNANGNTDRLKVALTFLYTARGIPCLYYGTEQAFNGGGDPYNREDMFAGQFKDGPAGVDSFNMTHPLFLHVAQLNNFRRLYASLRTGSHVNLWKDSSGPGLFAYARRLGTEETFVVFNTAGNTQTLPSRPTIYPAGTLLVNLLDANETATVIAGPQTPPIALPGTSAKIFVAQSLWQALDPVVCSNSPSHDAISVPTYSPVVLQFSEPMDTNSVQAAFNTTPPVSGAFAWSAARDTMTFTAGGAGLQGRTSITVRLTNTVVGAISGNAMFAPFEMRFKTAATSFVDNIAPTVAISSPTNYAVIRGNLNVSGVASDNIAIQKVEISLDNGPWLTATGTAAWSCTLNSSNFLNGQHLLSARATDSSGNLSGTNAITVRFVNVPGGCVQRISGGYTNDVTDCSNNLWLRDQAYSFGSFGYVGGAMGYLANTVSGICTAAQPLYQRERYSTSSGGFYYQFDCPAGIYETTLLETETYWSAAGKRVFNIFIQGRQVATNLDVFAATGGMNRPLTLVYTNTVTNAQLQVLFTPVVDNARVSGIQVRKIGDVTSDADGIPDWWRLAYFGHATGSAGDHSRAQDDADTDGMSNLQELMAGTDPTRSDSVLRVLSIAPQGTNTLIMWQAGGGTTNVVQATGALGGTFSNISPNLLLPGPGDVITNYLDSISTTGNTLRFYRIRSGPLP